jgi:hypothetical protein
MTNLGELYMKGLSLVGCCLLLDWLDSASGLNRFALGSLCSKAEGN